MTGVQERPKRAEQVMEKVTVWFGKEISIEQVKDKVAELVQMGYSVAPTFYIGYYISRELVMPYLKANVDASNTLYVIGKEGKIMQEILEYATSTSKKVVSDEDF